MMAALDECIVFFLVVFTSLNSAIMVFAFMKLRINNIFHHNALEKIIRSDGKSTTVSISTRT